MSKIINGEYKTKNKRIREEKQLAIYEEYTAIMKKKGAMKTGAYEILMEKYGYNSPLSIIYNVRCGKKIAKREYNFKRSLQNNKIKRDKYKAKKELETINNNEI